MARQQLSDLDFNNQARIINLPDPAAPQQAATKAYVDSAVEGLAWKDSVRAATTANVTIANPGTAVFDTVTLVANDRLLVRNQTAPAENGIYIFNGSATPLTRALDANTYTDLEAAVVTVEEGATAAGSTFRQTGVNGTIDTTPVTWGSFGTAAPAASDTTPGVIEIATQAEVDAGTAANLAVTPQTLANQASRFKRFSQTIGDGSATQFTVTHNLGTQDVTVAVYRASGAFDQVGCDIEHSTANAVTLRFASPPAANAFRVVVHA